MFHGLEKGGDYPDKKHCKTHKPDQLAKDKEWVNSYCKRCGFEKKSNSPRFIGIRILNPQMDGILIGGRYNVGHYTASLN